MSCDQAMQKPKRKKPEAHASISSSNSIAARREKKWNAIS